MKSKFKILILTSFLIYNTLNAQNFEWAKQMGGVSDDQAHFITIDASGNVYTTGYFSGTVDFDPGIGTYNLTSAGNGDIFISKLDSSGNFIWAKQMGGVSDDQAHSITIDTFGNIYTTGNFNGIADFDPDTGIYNLTSVFSYDIFISKLDANGNFVWAKQLAGTTFGRGRSIVLDASGNVYTTGYYIGTVDFDPGTGTYNLTSADYDIFISKLDSSGNFVWVKKMGGMSEDLGQSIKLDASGNIYTTGSFKGTADFNPSTGTYNLTSAGNRDVFVSKLDSSGNFIWAKKMGGTSDESAGSIVIDASGYVYTTGNFYGIADFDPGTGIYNLPSAGNRDIFVSKLDSSGNFVWAKEMGGTSDEGGLSIILDALGNVYTGGYFSGTVDFDSGSGTYDLISAGNYDAFLLKLDSSGNLILAKKWGGTLNDWCRSISLDMSGNLYTTGYFSGTADFDPDSGTYNLTSDSTNIFIQKLRQCVNTTSTDVITVCDSITWLDGITYTTSTNTPTFTLTNTAGCDSIVTLNLTINNLDTTITQNGDTLFASETGATYQWLDCNNGNAIISGEINQSYSPTSSGYYMVVVTKNDCSDSSACINVILTGISELENSYVKIYPNPITSEFIIDLASFSPKTQLSVVSIEGKIVYTNNTINANKIVINAADWSKGIYVVKITNEKGTQVLKLIKQ